MKIRASAILIFGAIILAGPANAWAWGHAGGGFRGGGFAVQSRPFVDHRFNDRRFFFAQRPFFVHRRFFAARPVYSAPPAGVVTPPAVVFAPVAPIDPFE